MNEHASELSREDLLAKYGKKSVDASMDATQRSPFKFLDSYEVEDADIFFGRDSEIEELLKHFHSYGHVLIYGESGSGKSSLVQCGLRSRIPDADALFISPRVHTTGLATLCHQIRDSASLQLGETVEVDIDVGLIDTLRAVRAAASRPLVLFFDQFEELFIFHDFEIREHFANELALIHESKLNIKVIIGIRQDYLAYLSELEDTVEGLFDNRFWLRRMSRENAAQAVVSACSTCDVQIDNDVAESILHSLDPGGHGVELPYLQVVMDRLYRQALEKNPVQPVITAEEVQKLGDIANILGTFLIEEVAKLPSPDTGRQILKAFVTREATRRTLDRAAVAQESASFGAAIPPDVLDAHLNQLVNVRILRDIADSGNYELRHDALAGTVAGWISEVEKELIEVRDNLVNRFKEFEARGQQDAALLDQDFMDYLAIYRQRLTPLLNDTLQGYLEKSQRHLLRQKRKKQLLIGGGVMAVILAGISVLFFVSAERKRNEAVVLSEQKRSDAALALAQKQSRAKGLVDSLFTADIARAPDLINNMEAYREWTNPLIEQEITKSADDPRKQLQASLALLPVDAEQVEYLYERMLTAEPQEVIVIRGALLSHKANLTEQLWTVLENPQHDQDERFRAACALASFAPDDPRWENFSADVAAMLVTQYPFVIPQWTDAFKGAGGWLEPPLAGFLADEKRTISARSLIATVYNKFAADIPDAYARLEERMTEVNPGDATKDAKVALAKEQASIGTALMIMGKVEKVWPLLRHSPDPTLRSFLIEWLAEGGVDPKVLMAQLGEEQEISVKRAILLSLGEYGLDRLSRAERGNYLPALLQLYREDPDPGIHGAAEWLLRQWDASDEMNAIDKEFSTGKVEGQRSWYLNRQGQTMVVVPKPGEYWMGEGAARHRRRIDHDFAIASKEVGVAQFLQFRQQHEYVTQYSPTEDCPMNRVTWYDAAAYCNWLSEQEGIPKAQWCYEPNKDGKYEGGMIIAANFRQRTGYRLPTEVEWEYTCRAGADTGHSFGDSVELLGKYGWSGGNALTKSHPAGSLKPNDQGLFDMHGNLWEWCQDARAHGDDGAKKGEAETLLVENDDGRVLRGGSFDYLAEYARSANKIINRPTVPRGGNGFRLARTYP